MKIELRVLALLGLVAACGGGTSASTVAGDAGPSDGALTSADGAADLGCGGSVGADVPEIYKRFFRCVDLSATSTDVVVHTKGLPPYKTYYYGQSSPSFAPFDTSRGTAYKPNPNVLKEQSVTLTIPRAPVSRGIVITPAMIDGLVNGPTASLDYKMGAAGVAINSVLVYNPLAAPGDNIENEKFTFDDYDAHPDQRGAYHYHTTSKGPLEQLVKLGFATNSTPGRAELEIYGVMCDGAFVLGCTELDGAAPDTGGLDAQNGHVHDLNGKDGAALATARYHIHLCPTGFATAPRKFTPQVQYYDKCVVQ